MEQVWGMGSRGPSAGLGAKPPEAEETLETVHVQKYFVCHVRCQSEHRLLFFFYTNLYTKCIGLQTFCEFTNQL